MITEIEIEAILKDLQATQATDARAAKAAHDNKRMNDYRYWAGRTHGATDAILHLSNLLVR